MGIVRRIEDRRKCEEGVLRIFVDRLDRLLSAKNPHSPARLLGHSGVGCPLGRDGEPRRWVTGRIQFLVRVATDPNALS